MDRRRGLRSRVADEEIANEDVNTNQSSSNTQTRRKRKSEIPKRPSKNQKKQPNMNDSIDYVALVEQHMKDEEMARRLQEEENRNRLGQSRPSLPPIVENIERRLSSANRQNYSSAPIERDFIDLTDDFEVEQRSSSNSSSSSSSSSALNRQIDEDDDDDLFGEGVNEAERRRYFGDTSSIEEDEEDMDYPEDSFFDNRAESPPPRRRNAVLVNQHNVVIPGGGRHSVQISLGNGSRASINSFNQAIAARGGRLFGSMPGGVMSFDLNGTAQFNRLLEHVMAHSENDEPQNSGLSQARINRLPSSEAASQSTQTCTICMENFKIGEKLRTLPCFHYFCAECVDPWLQRKDECPVCRVSAKAS